MLSNNTHWLTKCICQQKKKKKMFQQVPASSPLLSRAATAGPQTSEAKEGTCAMNAGGVLEVLNEADEKGVYFTIARRREFTNNVLIKYNFRTIIGTETIDL
jgi:hypothetical protein